MSQKITQQCEAITKRRGLNRLCKHTTSKSRFCWQHLKALEGFRIKKSTIPNAGLGLFYEGKKPIKKDSVVTEYTGKRVVTADPNYGNPYVLEVKKHTFIDASKTNEPGLGRWENDPRNKRKANTRFSYSTRTKKATMKATKEIKTGTELLVPYSAEYWKHYPLRKQYQPVNIKRLRKEIRGRRKVV